MLLRVGSSREGVLALLGLIHLGAVPVSVKPHVPGTAVERYFAAVTQQQGARHGFRVSGLGLTELRLVLRTGDAPGPAPGGPEDVAFIQYTSGSTGMPRPIPLSHRAVLGNIEAISDVAGMKPGHAGLIALPLHHDMGLIGVLTSLVRGIDLVVEEPGTFLRRPLAALRLVRDAEAVHSAFPDFMLRYLAARIGEAAGQEAPDPTLFGAWRTVFCGAEPIRQPSIDTFVGATRGWGFDPAALVFCYGLAEAALMATSHRYTDAETAFHTEGPVTTACLGIPMPRLDLRIVDASGRECAEAEAGAVQLRGATLFNGYDGTTDHRVAWFDTGDVGCLRSGRLHLSGRRSDRVSVNGVNVFAADVEQSATELPVSPSAWHCRTTSRSPWSWWPGGASGSTRPRSPNGWRPTSVSPRGPWSRSRTAPSHAPRAASPPARTWPRSLSRGFWAACPRAVRSDQPLGHRWPSPSPRVRVVPEAAPLRRPGRPADPRRAPTGRPAPGC